MSAISNASTTIPAAAAAVGYNLQTLGSAVTLGYNWQGNSWNGIDPNSTGAVQNPDGSVYLPGRDVGSTYNAQITSRSASSGIAFGGGGYFEATLSFTGTDASTGGTNQGGWPAWWGNTYETLNSGNSVPSQVETDFMEFLAPGSGGYGGALHNWYNSDGSQVSTNFPIFVAPPGTDFTQPHKYGWLWVPATATTQGYCDFYFDGVVIPAFHQTWNQYQPGQTAQDNPFAVMDVQHEVLFLGTGPNNPMTVYNVSVWQNSAANDISTLPPPSDSGGSTNPNPPPSTSYTPSANYTVVLAGSTDAIVDANGNNWTIINGKVAVNGTVDTPTSGVIELAYVDGKVWQEIGNGTWWGKTLPTDAWGPTTDGTTISPLPPVTDPLPPSANDTVVLAGSTDAIFDAHGNSWTIINGQVAVNGTVDTPTSGVIELAYVDGKVWQEIGNGTWWGKALPTDAWGPTTDGTTTSPLPPVSSGGTAAPPATYSGDGSIFTASQPKTVTTAVATYGDASYTTTLGHAAWNTIKSVQVAPTSWDASFASHLAYDNFVQSILDLRAAGTANLDVLAIGEKRGTVTLNNGTDTFTWVAGSNGGTSAANTMAIYAGDGADTITITAAALSTLDDSHNSANGSLWSPNYMGDNSVAEVHLGAGTDTVTIAGATRSFIYGGTGNAVVTCGAGADTIAVGAGGGDLTGGDGADLFVIMQGSGHARIEDFTPGLDKLDFRGMTSAAISSVSSTEQGVAGLLVTYDTKGDSVFLAHTNAVSASDMIYS